MKYSYVNKVLVVIISFITISLNSQITLEKEVKITDLGLFFDGKKVTEAAPNSTTGYDYAFGPKISVHGDCIFTYKHYVFMTWYKGGKENRHMMLTRYNQKTETQKTIQFPHRHTGFRNIWYIGESHNTIAVGVSPLDGTIHLLFDMHAYSKTRPSDGSLSEDYFRYAYSVKNAAEVSDEEFTLDLFVKDNNVAGDYTHLSLNGIDNYGIFSEFTYPKFFLNDGGDLFFSMRKGASSNGGYHFAKYDASSSSWSNFIKFADRNAKNHGQDHNWGMYGRLQYLNGKIRIGFQKRSNNKNDRYLYQNGFYYAYSDDQSGKTNWKNHQGETILTPLRDADEILVYEPGDLVVTTQKDKVYMVGNFDWTVTDRGDVHIIGRVKDNQFNVTKNVHTYKPAGTSEFITSTDFSGGSELYTSGNNIYMIGLNSSGRVIIQKSEGGENNFSKVYEATSGKQFRHGVVYIRDGKLYYYLMERKSGDQQPIYLQIIDLDLQIGPQPFAVNLVSPSNNQEFKEGRNIQLQVLATADEGEITKVQFLVNDEMVHEDNSKPFAFSWLPTNIGSYKVKAIAYKTGGASRISSEATIQVIEADKSDLTDDVYRLQNVSTGKFLGDAGGSANPISMNDKGEEPNTHWRFVKTTVSGREYYNIDSETNGILRATGSGFAAGANLVVSTGKGSPAKDSDKIWTIHYNEVDDTFRFESKDNDRYLYHDVDGNIYNLQSDESDQRSVWKAIYVGKVLSISNALVSNSSIQVYPNPAKNNFTISLENIETAKVAIYTILGKLVYKKSITKGVIHINDKLQSGVYLVKVFSENKKVCHSKLIIR